MGFNGTVVDVQHLWVQLHDTGRPYVRTLVRLVTLCHRTVITMLTTLLGWDYVPGTYFVTDRWPLCPPFTC